MGEGVGEASSPLLEGGGSVLRTSAGGKVARWSSLARPSWVGGSSGDKLPPLLGGGGRTISEEEVKSTAIVLVGREGATVSKS